MDGGRTTSAVNGRLWGTSAEDWAGIQEATCRPVYQAVFDHVGLKGGERYLDAGCGAGLAAQMAAARGAKVFGLDAAENLLAIAQSRVPEGEFHLGELESLPFSDGDFDVVTGFNSFQYAANRERRLPRQGGSPGLGACGCDDLGRPRGHGSCIACGRASAVASTSAAWRSGAIRIIR